LEVCSQVPVSRLLGSQYTIGFPSTLKDSPKIVAKPIFHHELGSKFFVRTLSGTTTLLRHRQTVPVLIKGSYSDRPDISSYSCLVCIAGGVGLTGILSVARRFTGDVEVFWGIQTQGMVLAMKDALCDVHVEITVCSITDLRKILTFIPRAFAIISGPCSMSDDVRVILS
jgi:hypothetical protein